jgi:inorganic pyrophosphatase/exopolyphosphatase
MNTQEFKAAFAIAKSSQDLSHVDTSHLFGYALKDFQPTATTLEAVAAIMRWQALYFNGNWNQEELDEIRQIGRKRFIISDSSFTLTGIFTEQQKNTLKAAARMVKAV